VLFRNSFIYSLDDFHVSQINVLTLKIDLAVLLDSEERRAVADNALRHLHRRDAQLQEAARTTLTIWLKAVRLKSRLIN